MTKILGVAGSLRSASLNAALLRAAAELAPEGTTIKIGSIDAIPLYNGDKEASDGIPKSVTELKEELADSDGLLLATPEYNNSIPGVLKNAMDWLSRPPADIPRVFGRRPVAIMGATPGGFGTVLSQSAWLPVLRTLGMQPWFGGRLYISGAGKLFDESGKLIDHDTSERLQNYISDFVKFIAGQ